MHITAGDVTLRDMRREDIEDYVRWFTSETEWADWDAPWEQEETSEAAERESWTRYFESLRDMPEDTRRWKFDIDLRGRHVGWVSAYLVDENYEWISADAVKPGQTTHLAVGIDIPEQDARGGTGAVALGAFIGYLRSLGFSDIYTQTWSGNARMLRCAEKLGFRECARRVGVREVRGGVYDAVTLRLEV